VTYATNIFTFYWTSLTGELYQVQFTTNLNGNVWHNLGGLITASNLTAGISDTNASNSERFYRVAALSPAAVPSLVSSQPQVKAFASLPVPITNTRITHYLLRGPQ
jgi:hypothetical protein